MPPVWNEVGAVGVFKGNEGAGNVLEEERYKRPFLPGRFFLLEERGIGLLALMPPGAERFVLDRVDHQRAQVLFDHVTGVAAARLRC